LLHLGEEQVLAFDGAVNDLIEAGGCRGSW
jgi:hypothetical protein